MFPSHVWVTRDIMAFFLTVYPCVQQIFAENPPCLAKRHSKEVGKFGIKIRPALPLRSFPSRSARIPSPLDPRGSRTEICSVQAEAPVPVKYAGFQSTNEKGMQCASVISYWKCVKMIVFWIFGVNKINCKSLSHLFFLDFLMQLLENFKLSP